MPEDEPNTQTGELFGDLPPEHLDVISAPLLAYESGDLAGGAERAQQALAEARLGRDATAELVALYCVAVLQLHRGAFAEAAMALELADDVDPETGERVACAQALLASCRGALLTLRGDLDAGEEAFERAIQASRRVGASWCSAYTRAVRAVLFARLDHRLATTDARSAYDAFVDMGHEPGRKWAVRAMAVAAAEAGQPETAAELLQTSLDEELGPLDRALALYHLGEALLQNDQGDEARRVLEEARDLFESSGARYFLVRTYLKLGEADTGRASFWRERALEESDEDPAYDRLFADPGHLTIRVLGLPGAFAEGARLRFRTKRAELLVYALALSHGGTLHRDELMERLWPSAPLDRAGARLRTTLWEARQALGTEAWRLRREGHLVRIDLMGVSCDLLDAEERAHQLLASERDPDPGEVDEVLAMLERPLLRPWQYADWVTDMDARRQGLVDGLRSLRGSRPEH